MVFITIIIAKRFLLRNGRFFKITKTICFNIFWGAVIGVKFKRNKSSKIVRVVGGILCYYFRTISI